MARSAVRCIPEVYSPKCVEKRNSPKFAVASCPALPRSYAVRTGSEPLFGPRARPFDIDVARICCKRLRLATARTSENFEKSWQKGID
jgi:hypothetical protein